ncbi:hypothetical protein DFAR_30011 [Desulfarculales bacterium]
MELGRQMDELLDQGRPGPDGARPVAPLGHLLADFHTQLRAGPAVEFYGRAEQIRSMWALARWWAFRDYSLGFPAPAACNLGAAGARGMHQGRPRRPAFGQHQFAHYRRAHHLRLHRVQRAFSLLEPHRRSGFSDHGPGVPRLPGPLQRPGGCLFGGQRRSGLGAGSGFLQVLPRCGAGQDCRLFVRLGTGKTYLARELSRRQGGLHFSSDSLRK